MKERKAMDCRLRLQLRRFGHFSGIALQVATLLMVVALTRHAAGQHWVGTWATVPVAKENNPKPGESMIGGDDVTRRQIVHTSIGGYGLRIVLSNAFGIAPLKIGAVEVGISTGMATDGMVAKSAHLVTFGGQAHVTIPAGAEVVSDAAALPTRPETDLAISVFVPMQEVKQLSFHSAASTTNFIVKGDQTTSPTLRDAQKVNSWYLLKSIDVEANVKNSAAVVAFGDSITDGSASLDTSRRWPDDLGGGFWRTERRHI
jgi:hypothetical protein